MAIATPTLVTNGSGSDFSTATSYDTTTITGSDMSPTANGILIATGVSYRTSGGNAKNPTVSDDFTGGSLSWVDISSKLATSSNQRLVWAKYALVGSSPGTGGLQIDFGANTHHGIWFVVCEIASGYRSSTPVIQSANPSSFAASSITGTLAAFESAANMFLAVVSMDSNAAHTIEAGFTGLTALTTSSPSGRCQVIYQAGNGDLSLTDTKDTGTADFGMVAWELADAASAPSTAKAKSNKTTGLLLSGLVR